MAQEITRTDQIRTGLVAAQRQITSILKDEANAKKFMASALIVANNKNLKDCTPESIIQSLIGIAMSDLNIDPNIGHAYIVPFWSPSGSTAQLQVGYRGYIQLLFRAGWLVKALPVYACDSFSMRFNGWDNEVQFIQDIDSRDEGDSQWCYENLRGVYVIARHADTKDEVDLFVSRAVIEKLRLKSSNQQRAKDPADRDRLKNGLPIGIWQEWYVEMATAKAIKKLAKLLPLGDKRAQIAIATDDQSEIGNSIDYIKTNETGVITEQPMKISNSKEAKRQKILEEIEEDPDLTPDPEKTMPDEDEVWE
jgi:recombination protein RecT